MTSALALASLWALALFVVQELTTGPNYPLPLAKGVGSRIVRLLLDWLACGALVVALSGWRRYALPPASGLVWLVFLVYHDYFGRTLSFSSLRTQYREGLSVLDFGVALVPWRTASWVGLIVMALMAVTWWANRRPIAAAQRRKWLALLVVGYCSVALLSTQLIDRVEKLKTFATVDRIAMTNGYLLTWLGEWHHLDEGALRLKALEAAKVKSDRLTPLEPAVALGAKVAIVQVESLEWDVLGHDVDGEPVTPFLRELAASSQRYRITGIHESGSCDADFTMLTNLNPVGEVTPYAVAGFDFTRSLATEAARRGYHTLFLHGNHSNFFNRGTAVAQMGFDAVLFREQLVSEHGLEVEDWGVADRDVLRLSAELLRADEQPQLHFVITLTSHGPYHFLDPEDVELFDRPSGKAEHYLNSMRYVDRELEAYVGALPAATTVVIYGDHRSYTDYGQNELERGYEYVPLLVHRVGADLSRTQRTRDLPIAVSGELTLLDAAGWVWSWFGDRPAAGEGG